MKQPLQALISMITVLTVCLFYGSTVFSVFAEDMVLADTPDAGLEYQNSLLFFGESTTTHLKSRGVLTGKERTEQILANGSGTMTLSPKITEQEILHPKTGERMSVTEILRLQKPAYLVLSFGLNGILGFSKDIDSYLRQYQRLIDCIQQASPKTAIILQTVYPVRVAAKNEDWRFSVSPEEINRMIDVLNQALPSLAAANTAVRIADTASVLKDENGQLRADYATEDGIHLRAEAYQAILHYLRTHAYHLPTPLPITPDQWRKPE